MTRTIVVYSLEPWDTVWRRNQYVVDGLLRTHPETSVVFVEPPTDVLHDILSRRRPRLGSGWIEVPGYEGRLARFEPTKWLPRVVGPLADRLLHRSVASALKRHGIDKGISWVNDARWAALVERLEWPALYDMTDDWLAADRPERQLAGLRADEDVLMRICGAVVVCSQGLLETRSGIRPDAVLIRNAVDVSRYRIEVERPRDLPLGAALYVGTLHEDRLDIDLALATARALEAVHRRLVFVGPIALDPRNRDRLEQEPNIELLGPRHRDQVPDYLQHADVLTVPHVVNEFTGSLDPIKLYEYLAVGRPIVATRVAGFQDIADLPGVAVASATEFPEAVVRAGGGAKVLHAHVRDWSDAVHAFEVVLDRISPE